eukprot:TRINITY_DN47517_c0_g1_i1.p2 TRINITY_DN47517_c0_g1~~TRINITY_DN47517_c0_g1_i1.p2  ORF type:complete len:338 (+),score=51.41 TRINITY_DN47517_c0_g1_i1:200-1213(+)
MSAAGFDVPRVKVNHETDMALKPAGKKCHAMGLPRLPGGMSRSYSCPKVLSCPGGWLHHTLQEADGRRSAYQNRMRETATLSDSMARGEFGRQHATIRASTSHGAIPAGGRTQGAKHYLQPNSVAGHPAAGDRPRSSARHAGGEGFRYCSDSRAYNHARFGWHDPRGQAEAARLAEPSEPGSWAWTMRKARDHVGYGDDGVVNQGDVQITAISGDGPDWFIGTRTQPGPLNTKIVPVRRCPHVSIEGNKVMVRAKTYNQGMALDVLETTHDGPDVPPVQKAPPNKTVAHFLSQKVMQEHPAKKNNFYHGGCQIHAPQFPPTRHRFLEQYENALRRPF